MYLSQLQIMIINSANFTISRNTDWRLQSFSFWGWLMLRSIFVVNCLLISFFIVFEMVFISFWMELNVVVFSDANTNVCDVVIGSFNRFLVRCDRWWIYFVWALLRVWFDPLEIHDKLLGPAGNHRIKKKTKNYCKLDNDYFSTGVRS